MFHNLSVYCASQSVVAELWVHNKQPRTMPAGDSSIALSSRKLEDLRFSDFSLSGLRLTDCSDYKTVIIASAESDRMALYPELAALYHAAGHAICGKYI